MALLNYSTKIPAAQTAGEIQQILARHGARAVIINYGEGGIVEGISFQIKVGNKEVAFRLPIDWQAVLRILEKQHRAGNLRSHQARPDREQAVKVAWRIVKDWVEAQMAILETEMVRMEQIFLPYVITPGGHTLYEVMVERRFLLGPGSEEERDE